MALALAVTLAAAADGEALRERTIDIEIASDGTLLERTRLVIGLENADDAYSWATYRLFLEANRELESLEARVRRPDGSVRTIGADRWDKVARRVGGVLFSSQRDLLVHFDPLAVGDQLEIEHVVRFAPYFPASHVNLRGIGGVGRLRVRVRGSVDGIRWRIVGPPEGLETIASDQGVEIIGRGLIALDVPPHALEDARRSRLLFAWGPEQDWNAVARWYGDQVAARPLPPPAVAEAAQAQVTGATNPREKLDRLIAFLDRQVRYVAVTVGEGNVRPSPVSETLARGWGDCKDKAVLLVSMLRSVGIEAFPALVRNDLDGRVDPEFPALFPFNHAITAIPTSAVDVLPGEPVADGFLFVDSTQERAAGRWLVPGLQGQRALIVEPGGGRLVELPLLPEAELRRFEADLVVTSGGTASGRIVLLLRGDAAYRSLVALEQLHSVEAEAEARSLVAAFLPGSLVDDIAIGPVVSPVPAFRVEASVRLPALFQGLGGARPSTELPGLRAAPDPRTLEDRQVAAALPISSVTARWRLRLPPGLECRVPAPAIIDADPVGRFVQQVTLDAERVLEVRRETTLAVRFVEPEHLGALEALALAEHRAHRRRVRLDCAKAADGL